MRLKGYIIKAIISIVLSQDKEAYMVKEAAGYSKGKRAKISIITVLLLFFQNSTRMQV